MTVTEAAVLITALATLLTALATLLRACQTRHDLRMLSGRIFPEDD